MKKHVKSLAIGSTLAVSDLLLGLFRKMVYVFVIITRLNMMYTFFHFRQFEQALASTPAERKLRLYGRQAICFVFHLLLESFCVQV